MIVWEPCPCLSSGPNASGVGRLASFLRGGGDPARIDREICDLRVFLERVPDPRRRRGVRHSLISILLVAAAAVAAGARSFVAIGERAADAPQRLPKRIGARSAVGAGRYCAPDEAAVRRVMSKLDGDAFDTGSATPPTAKTPPASAPATPPESWPARATSPSAPCASPDTPTSPSPYGPGPQPPTPTHPLRNHQTDTARNNFAGPLGPSSRRDVCLPGLRAAKGAAPG